MDSSEQKSSAGSFPSELRRDEPLCLVMIGATGLVGEACLRRMTDGFSRVSILCLGRRPPAIQSSMIRSEVDPPELWESHLQSFSAPSALCCFGTTRKKAGSAEEFRRIDHGIPLEFAAACRRRGVRQFHMVSSVGASADSKNLYLKTKGQLEGDIQNLGFEQLFIYRPSLLLGARTEHRFGESLAQKLFDKISPVINILPSGKKYVPIHGETLAGFIVQKIFSGKKSSKVAIFENQDMIGI